MEIIKTEKDLFIQVAKADRMHICDKPFTPIEIIETKEQHDDEFGCVRLYNDYIGDPDKNENTFKLQVRAYQPLSRTTKARNIIASVSLKDSEIMALAEYVIEKRKKHGTFSGNK